MLEKIEELLSEVPPSLLKEAFEKLSTTYREGGGSHFREENQRLAYLATRVPATYAVATKVLSQLPFPIKSWIDVGAGPGTASWAAAELFPEAEKVLFFEKSQEMMALGKKLSVEHPLLQKSEWILGRSPPQVGVLDAAIFSYSLGELDNAQEWISWWWEAKIPFLIVIEPGTPARFAFLRKVREEILSRGGFLVAPCPHARVCPIQGTDWCHFSVRFNRTRVQRYVKDGALGYEDEKFSYLIVSRNFLPISKQARVLRHPYKLPGRVGLTLCKPEGNIQETLVSKRDKIFYKEAKKLKWGDQFPQM
ncbi:MAG: hypothetical protein A3F67_03060 [Verrucomicrobia bacterium RIFCSPHIGHO2_12_FULL_41_10]|nr:MAG: hypothetical protein A3F67_03060 [Verrucomicrobia bacterium RIFCSPHIGHO2_12_FULL_41_10]